MGELTPRAAEETGGALARTLAFAAVAAGFVLVAFALLGGDDGYRYKLRFETGGQLVPGNEILVAGQPVGTIDEIILTDDGEAEVQVTLDRPLTEGVTAEVRATSLSGIANRYISLHPGPNNAEEIPEDAVVVPTDTTTAVDIDQLFDTFNPRARKALRDVIRGQADVYSGAEVDANRTYRFIAPGLQSTRRLLGELNSDSRAFEQFLVSGSRVLGAVAERRDDLSQLTENANGALGAIADEQLALDRSLSALPPAMRQANTTFVNLRAALDDLDPLVATAKTATVDLAPFLRNVRPVAERAVPVLSDLRTTFDRTGRNNDLSDALADLPRARDKARDAVPNAIDALDQTQDEVEFARPYSPDLLAFLSKLGQITANYDADGHYARIAPTGANLFDYNEGTEELEPIPPSEQFSAYPALGQGPFTRCPGGATQAIAGSNPFLDDGALTGLCDSTDVPPGP